MASVRDRRLTADFDKIQALVRDSGRTVRLESSSGRPPDQYVLGYQCRGISALASEPSFREAHSVQIQLPATYPVHAPTVRFLSPIVHPHIFAGTNIVCIGGWTINEQLDQLVLRIGAIIQWDPQYFNFGSPANQAAAEWAKRNQRRLPLGAVTFKGGSRKTSGVEWKEL
jgi:ubiquitin-protein ligase